MERNISGGRNQKINDMKNTEENNVLIAEFMGEEIGFRDTSTPCILGNANAWKPIKYHTSWDWLMPAVNLCKERQFFGSQNMINNIDDVLTCDCELNNLFEAVVEFVDFYNMQQ